MVTYQNLPPMRHEMIIINLSCLFPLGLVFGSVLVVSGTTRSDALPVTGNFSVVIPNYDVTVSAAHDWGLFQNLLVLHVWKILDIQLFYASIIAY